MFRQEASISRLWPQKNWHKSLAKNGEKISAHADGGPRSPSAHAGPFARPPISMSGNFLAHMSAESPSNISPNPSEVISEVSEP